MKSEEIRKDIEIVEELLIQCKKNQNQFYIDLNRNTLKSLYDKYFKSL